MSKIIGIDLGTTFCAISVLDDTGRPTIINIPDKKIAPDGNIISSCVLFQTDKVIIGDQARRALQLHRKAFGRFKRDMGTSKDKVDSQKSHATRRALFDAWTMIKHILDFRYQLNSSKS